MHALCRLVSRSVDWYPGPPMARLTAAGRIACQGKEDSIPAGVRPLVNIWETLYWLSKTSTLCDGSLSELNRQKLRQMLNEV